MQSAGRETTLTGTEHHHGEEEESNSSRRQTKNLLIAIKAYNGSVEATVIPQRTPAMVL